MDVDVTSSKITNIYGIPSSKEIYERIDHCAFEYAKKCFAPIEVIDTVDGCTTSCTKNTRGIMGCNGVMLQPLTYPHGVINPHRNKDNIPTAAEKSRGVTWSCYDRLEKARNDPKVTVDLDAVIANAIAAGKEPTLCYRVQARVPSATFNSYEISFDPESPTFYSTCYVRKSPVDFEVQSEWWAKRDDVKLADKSLEPWEFEDQCISCKDMSQYSASVPTWKLSPACVDCDSKQKGADELKPTPKKSVKMSLVASQTRCDGWPTWANPDKHHSCSGTDEEVTAKCFKMPFSFERSKKYDWGIPYLASAAECKFLTYRDPECSDTFWFSQNEKPSCVCLKKNPCCGGCSPVHRSSGDIYEINSTPDPTCATGTTFGEPNKIHNPPDSERKFSSLKSPPMSMLDRLSAYVLCVGTCSIRFSRVGAIINLYPSL